GPVVYMSYDEHEDDDDLSQAYASTVDVLASSIKIPASYFSAISEPNRDLWIPATDLEFKALARHQVYTPDWLPPGRRALDFRWVFTVKELEDGSLERVKARIAMRGFTQVEGIDFTETFSPVVKFSTIKAQLTVCAARNDEFYKVDVYFRVSLRQAGRHNLHETP
ncbi:MAG: reverse transcriptase domain-containing protein, partial [Proteobacteria bacterium]|nr:reverse transcriptase domain-containing protein [Pseudomonadota bacterium]